MFVVTEAEAAAIRAAYEQRGEFSAAVELRRLFPAVTDTVQARACARTIADGSRCRAAPGDAAGTPRKPVEAAVLEASFYFEKSGYRNKSNKIRSETWPTRMC